MCVCVFPQIVFRKISDVKREEEERLKRKNEAPLDLPPDHPVRRLFQRFRQQKEARLAAEQTNRDELDIEKGHVQNDITRDPVATTSIVTVTESPATPIPSNSSTSHVRNLLDRDKLQAPNALGIFRASEGRGSRGWARFRESRAQRESWANVAKAESMETLPKHGCKSAEPGNLKKTDSCDSGFTKSDLKLDEGGGTRTPTDHSPVSQLDKRPPPTVPPIPEYTLHSTLLDMRAELRVDLMSLGNRISALESQLAEMLQLLQDKKSTTPHTPLSYHISHPASPESDKEDIFC